jgi:hypothetical protein
LIVGERFLKLFLSAHYERPVPRHPQ